MNRICPPLLTSARPHLDARPTSLVGRLADQNKTQPDFTRLGSTPLDSTRSIGTCLQVARANSIWCSRFVRSVALSVVGRPGPMSARLVVVVVVVDVVVVVAVGRYPFVFVRVPSCSFLLLLIRSYSSLFAVVAS